MNTMIIAILSVAAMVVVGIAVAQYTGDPGLATGWTLFGIGIWAHGIVLGMKLMQPERETGQP